MSAIFDFLSSFVFFPLVFFPLSPYVIVFYFVSFDKLYWVGWYKTPLEDFVQAYLILLKIVFGRLV